MPAIQHFLAVEMEDGEKWEVTADQRDLAAWEVQDFWAPTRAMTMIRFIAWSASHRKKLTKLSWDEFNDKCVDVGGQKRNEQDEALDPTKPVLTGGNSRTSQQ